MQPESVDAVYGAIIAHIGQQGGAPSSWYAGISSDWRERVLIDHKVPSKGHWYIARQCFSDDDARRVESSLIHYGCSGGGGGGDQSSVYVYAYLKSAVTDP